MSKTDMTREEQIISGFVVAEMRKGLALHGPFSSAHEAYGVLAEEVAELLDAIRDNEIVDIVEEAIQVSAVAMRLAKELEEKGG